MTKSFLVNFDVIVLLFEHLYIENFDKNCASVSSLFFVLAGCVVDGDLIDLELLFTSD